ncbi:hypothetical protein RFI_15719 [Reticulomyxa filosa]|uniref:Structural maintenance of chromosomes protein 4 n=1 Tax=Reticulomyxa filosa TaxID=46433 RepID=X6N861_RETFI|nr:hypothetical protein RFI_15719 [Reticulomyxa filosa]|eukprot:ETO21487.1 hypothetical protein RFI_15719 [Reticulomyxa filosa]
MVDTQTERNEWDQQDSSLRERFKHLNDEYKRISANLNNVKIFHAFISPATLKNFADKWKVKPQKNYCFQLTDQIKESQSTVENNEKQIPLLEKEVKKIRGNDVPFGQQIQPIREAMEKKQRQLIPKKDKQNEIQQQLDGVIDDIKSIEQKRYKAQDRKKELIDRIAQVETEIKEKVSMFVIEFEGKQKEFTVAEREKQEISQLCTELERQDQQLSKALSEAQIRATDMKQNFDRQRNRHGIIAALLDAQSKGHLSGIIGRIGDLGSIDGEFDIAASTAASAQLNHILVEKTSHAQKAVEYLKLGFCFPWHIVQRVLDYVHVNAKKIGSFDICNFGKQKEQLQNRLHAIETPEKAPRVFDLVKVQKPEYRYAFYYAFRDTLVAENMDQATRLAFQAGQRWRVVTKQGQLIEPVGTMSGGGNKPFSGLMSNKAVEEEEITINRVQELEKQVADLTNKCQDIRNRRRTEQNKLLQLEKDIDKMKLALRKMKMNLNSLVQSRTDLKEQLTLVTNETGELSNEDQEKLAQLQQDQEKIGNNLNKAQNDCQSLEAEIEQMEQQILDSGGSELRNQKNITDCLRSDLESKNCQITKMKVEIEKCRKKIVTNRKKQEEIEEELKKTKEEKEQIRSKRQELVERGLESLNRFKQKESEYKETEEHFKSLEEVVKTKEEKLTGLAKQVLAVKEKCKEYNAEEENTKARISKLSKEWEALAKRHENHKIEYLGEDTREENVAIDSGKGKQSNSAEPMEVDPETVKHPNDDSNTDTDTDNDVKMKDVSEVKEEKQEVEETVHPWSKSSLDTKEYLNPTYIYKLVYLSFEQLSQILREHTIEQIDEEMVELNQTTTNSKVNLSAIEAYRTKDEDYVRRLHDLQNYKEQRDAKRKEYENLKKERHVNREGVNNKLCNNIQHKIRHTMFMNGFQLITTKLKEMYRMLTCGGDAELELVDSIDPFSEGVSFSVRPPKKSWKNISNLSGGEKTLSSMALVFALHQYKPTPLYFMDEIDAALDFKNVSIVANYVKSRTKDAQFVVISLRNNMFELANQLVGIYKTHDCSKSITIDPKRFHLPFMNQNENGSNPLTQPPVATTQIVSTPRSGAQKSFTTPYAKLKCNILFFSFFLLIKLFD